MEKEMLAIAKFKSGEGKFEKFMGWMQSDEGMGVRKTIAHVEKTVPAIAPNKSYVMFKVSVHNEENMKQFASGQNPVAKPIFDECIESVQMWEMSPVKLKLVNIKLRGSGHLATERPFKIIGHEFRRSDNQYTYYPK